MQLSPEQVELIFRFILPTVKNEHQITSKMIRAFPPDKGDFRPDPVSRSAFDLASHIAGAEMMFLRGIADGEFKSGVSPEGANTSEVADWYDANFQKALDRLQPLTADQLSKTITFAGVFTLPAFVYLSFAVNHSIHHRGQLSTYFRPVGAKVPSIYGKSFDDANG